MIVYISGPMTGIDNYYVLFKEAQHHLESMGFDVINPAFHMDRLPEGLTYEQFMKIDLALLDACDAIYLLKGWENSKGANRELGFALGKGLKIMFQGDEHDR